MFKNILLRKSYFKKIEADLMYEYLKKLDTKHMEVLDLSCGEGLHAYELSFICNNVIGVDIDETSLKAAKKINKNRNNVKIKYANSENLPFKKNRFDLIVCLHSLEHYSNDIQAIKEMYRTLKPNGYLILSLPIAENGILAYTLSKKVFGLQKWLKGCLFTNKIAMASTYDEFMTIIRDKIWQERHIYTLEKIKKLFTEQCFVIQDISYYIGIFGGLAWDLNILRFDTIRFGFDYWYLNKKFNFFLIIIKLIIEMPFYILCKLDNVFKTADITNSHHVMIFVRKAK